MSGAGAASFAALPPQAVPSLACVRAEVDAAMLAMLAGYGAVPSSAAEGLLTQALAVLPPADAAAEAPWRAPETADDAAHDRYFGIRRVGGATGAAGAVFLRSVVDGARCYHAELPPSGGFAALRDGFAALLGHLAGLAAPPGPAEVAVAPAADPMRRWIVGHQVFAALSQGIVFALQEFEAAMPAMSARPADAEAALDLAARLLLASAAAFRFTGDFAPAQYRDVIRPSMGPAHVGDGFSGLLSADHRQLIHVLGRVRPLMIHAQTHLPAIHGRLTAAMQQVYADHKFVCARFDGADLPSLRGSGEHGSGVAQLDRFAHARLRLLRPAVAGGRARDGRAAGT